MPMVGAIVVNYNSGKHLSRCLDALSQQEVPFFRVIIIDNNAQNQENHLPFSLPEGWELICLGYNAGFAAANNIAVNKLADCQWVALVNPDAYLHPAWLKYMCDAIRTHQNYSFFASRLMMANEPTKVDGLGDVYHMSGLVWRAGHGRMASNGVEKEIFSPCAAAALYKRDAFLEAGGFDPDFFCFVEDVDLGFRLQLLGHRCLLVKKAIAYHVGSTSTGGRHSAFSIYHGHRNMVWAFVKNMPAILFWAFLPVHLALHVFSIGWFFCKGQGKTISRSKIDAIHGLSKMWRKRKAVQGKRVLPTYALLSKIDKSLIPKRHKI
jgi:GT2 family glycosyltransferase